MRSTLLSLIPLLAAAPAAAQAYHYTSSQEGSITLDHFGDAIVGLGDVDGDGYEDYAVGASTEAGLAGLNTGAVHVYSGANGAQIQTYYGVGDGALYGDALANVGDLDGDFVDDLLIGSTDGGFLVQAPGPGLTEVRSGATGALIRTHLGTVMADRFGCAVAGIGDQTGDGVPDYAIGARGYDPGLLQDAGAVFVHDGATGALLYQVDGSADFGHFGASLAALGDLTGDGRGEWIGGAPDAPRTGVGAGVGYARVTNGVNGGLVWLWQGQRANDRFGSAVAGIADQNADGVPEVLIGAPRASTAFVADLGAVDLYSGQTGSLIRRIHGPIAGSRYGSWVGQVRDMNGDDKPDVATGAPGLNQVAFHDGLTSFLLGGLSAPDGALRFGATAAQVGDLDGDDEPEFLVGAPGPATAIGPGSVHLYRNEDLPEGFHWTRSTVNGRWYGILREVDWAAATAAADAHAGCELVTVHDLSEQDWLWEVMLGGDGTAYIGLTDELSEGNFVWRSGETTPWWAANNYFGVGGVPGYWYLQEPNNLNNEDYVTIGRPGVALPTGEWNDTKGLAAQDALFEWTQPPTVSLGFLGGCPGVVAVAVGGATPGGNVAIVYGQAGSTMASAGSCGQVLVPLSNPRLHFVMHASPTGSLSFAGSLPPSACGSLRAVALDLGSCVFSNLIYF